MAVKVEATKMPKLYTGLATIEAQITSLHTKGQTMQAQMHKLALSVLMHVGLHNDIRIVHKFIAAMPDMARTNGLRAWFEANGPIKFTVVDKTEQITFVKGKAVCMGPAHNKPFWKFSAKEGAPYEPLDITAYTETVIKRLRTDAEKTGRNHNPLINAMIAGRVSEALPDLGPVTEKALKAKGKVRTPKAFPPANAVVDVLADA